MHLTAGVFGDAEFAKKFGKGHADSDIAIRNHADSGDVITFVSPASDKVQPLLQAAAMADLHVVVVNEVNQAVGEIIILLSEMGVSNGVFVTDYHEDVVSKMVKGTSLETFAFTRKNEQEVWEKVRSAEMDRSASPILVTIDTFFDVKGVGSVILGLVKSGSVKQYDKLVCYPLKKEVLVKSMQSQDKDVKETEPGHRIGIAAKGVEVSELRRGYVLSDKEVKCADTLSITFSKNKYSKYELTPGKQLFAAIGQQVVSGTIKSVNGKAVETELSSPAALYSDTCILATNDSVPRIVGSGKIE